MYSHSTKFPQEFGKYAEKNPQKYFLALAYTGPACMRIKINSPRICPARVGSVLGVLEIGGHDRPTHDVPHFQVLVVWFCSP